MIPRFVFLVIIWLGALCCQAQKIKGLKIPKEHKTFFKSLRAVSETSYLSDTEITNQQYQEFVDWVRDSVAHRLLGHRSFQPSNEFRVDWNQELDYSWGGELDSLFRILPEGRMLRTELLIWNSPEGNKIPVYPNTDLWLADLNYKALSQSFSDSYYADHPVVGISFQQAEAYCTWKTIQLRQAGLKVKVRLPRKAEWTKAASSSVVQSEAWALPEVQDGGRKYSSKWGKPSFEPVKAWPANEDKFYGMLGNVREWLSDAGKIYQAGGDWLSGKEHTKIQEDEQGGQATIFIGLRVCVEQQK